MNTPPRTFRSALLTSSLFGVALLLTLAGCYDSPRQGYGYRREPSRVQVVVQDDYVYYPDYEVYYNNTRHQYVYFEGNVWVTRPEPPRIWARDLPRAPSVRLEFHDSPERHHAEVVRTYPKHGRSPKQDDRHDNRRDKDDDRRDRDDRR